MRVRICLSLLVALAFAGGISVRVSAQSLPLSPSKITAKLLQSNGGVTTWRVGPILLELPESWADDSRSHVVSLKGPNDAVATFVATEAEKDTRERGYSILRDAARGPESFTRQVQWDDCEGNPSRIAKPLAAASGHKTFYAECAVEVRPGVRASYAQVALYAASHVVQVHVVGRPEVVAAFLRALEGVKWPDET